jgi:hypothetical protein
MKYPDHMDEIFDRLDDLTLLQRHTIKERYRFLMAEYRRRCRIYASLFYSFRLTMTVGSLAVPALLSIQNSPGAANYLYWLTWGVSLAVTTANGIMTLFKLDKRFFMLHATAEQLRSETWQYVALSGRYSGHHGNHKPTHNNQFVYYCSQLEKINMVRINDEYIKNTEDTKQPSPAEAKASTVPTPSDKFGSPESPSKESVTTVDVDEQDAISLSVSEVPPTGPSVLLASQKKL